MMHPVKSHVLLSLILLLLAGMGCGYRLAGEGWGPPSEIRSIAVTTFNNETYEAGIETTVTNALLRELIKDRRLKVVGQHEADAIMEGTVTSFTTSSVAYDPTGVVLEYRTWVTLDVMVRRHRKGEILWTERGLLESAVYKVSSEVLLTEAEKGRAVQTIAEKLARRIRRRLFEGL